MLLRGAGIVAAVLVGRRAAREWTRVRVSGHRTRRPAQRHSARPACPASVYWLVVATLLASLLGAGVDRLADRSRGPGTAATATRTASPGPRPAATSTPSHPRRHSCAAEEPSDPHSPHPGAEDVGYLLGHSRGREIWASVEDSILVIGPPRSGKGLHLVINAILDAPGAVVTTSTRPDNITATIHARQERGPVAVFDPQQLDRRPRRRTPPASAGPRSAAARNP